VKRIWARSLAGKLVVSTVAVISLGGCQAVQKASVNSHAVTVGSATLSFGNVTVGQTATLNNSLLNTSGASITITGATIAGSNFSIGGLSLPLTVAVGQSVPYTVTFAPKSAGSASGTLIITLSDSTTAPPVSLTGMGMGGGQLSATPSSLAFGGVQVGSSQTLSITLTNSSGSSVTVTKATPSGSGVSVTGLTLPLVIAANSSANVNVIFAPATGGAVTGNVTFLSNAPNPSLVVSVSGTGLTAGALVANPSSVSFGSVRAGSSQSKTDVLTNTGSSPVTISQATASGAGFSIGGINVPLTLNGGQSLTYTVTFAPATAGSSTGNVAITSDATNTTLNVALSGTGTTPGQIAITPPAVNFGNVAVGSNKSATGSVSASGGSVTITSASSNNPEFSISGLTLPVTLASGQSASFTSTFSPQASGSTNGNISFVSNAANSPVQALSGAGVAATQHSVSLLWNPSTSAVVGYNVYRGTISGGPYTQLNTSVDPSTSYTDNTVQSGQTYFYVTTALDASNNESPRSNEVQAVIPFP
jgi:hypothetical protein